MSILLGNRTEELLGMGQLGGVTIRLSEKDGKLTELTFTNEQTEQDGSVLLLDADLKPQPMTES